MSISVFRGDDKSIKVTITDDGVAKDITGWTLFFTAKRRLSDPDSEAAIAKEVTQHTDAENGITHIVLTPDDTSDVGNLKADIQVVDDQGKVQTYRKFLFIINQDVTLRTS